MEVLRNELSAMEGKDQDLRPPVTLASGWGLWEGQGPLWSRGMLKFASLFRYVNVKVSNDRPMPHSGFTTCSLAMAANAGHRRFR